MADKKIRIGVSGLGGRGQGWTNDLMSFDELEVVAACDISQGSRDWAKTRFPDLAYYDSIEEMLEHDIDAVAVITPAFQHANDAVAALRAGKHVISEVTACWTLAQAVELYEAAKASNAVYMFAENYSYFNFIQEMRRLYQAGTIGDLVFSDVHYCAVYRDMWVPYCRYKSEWRNWMPQTYYSTHALGPALYVTGLRPTEVTGFEVANGESSRSIGKRSDEIGNFVVKLNNGALINVTSMFMVPKQNHLWYHFLGDKGEMENDRYGEFDGFNVVTGSGHTHSIAEPTHSKEIAAKWGHAGGDYFVIHDFIEAIRGRSPISIDVRLGIEVSLPGILAHRSALMGNVKLEVPDIDDPAVRDRIRHDTLSPFPITGDGSDVPPSVLGAPEPPAEVCLEANPYTHESLQERFGVFHTRV